MEKDAFVEDLYAGNVSEAEMKIKMKATVNEELNAFAEHMFADQPLKALGIVFTKLLPPLLLQVALSSDYDSTATLLDKCVEQIKEDMKKGVIEYHKFWDAISKPK